MMAAEGGKRVVFDLAAAAEAIEPVVERQYPELAPEDRRHAARRWLDFECLGSGIVEEVSGRQLRFWHLTFQEFEAALQLAWLGDGHEAGRDWWPSVRAYLDDSQWRETIELLPGCLLDEGGEGRVDRLLERVLAARGNEPDLPTDARVAGVVGRLLEPLGVYDYVPAPAVRAAYQEALDRAMAVFTVEGAKQVPVADRIAAAEALGRGGDPRLRPGCDNFLEVPGSTARSSASTRSRSKSTAGSSRRAATSTGATGATRSGSGRKPRRCYAQQGINATSSPSTWTCCSR